MVKGELSDTDLSEAFGSRERWRTEGSDGEAQKGDPVGQFGEDRGGEGRRSLAGGGEAGRRSADKVRTSGSMGRAGGTGAARTEHSQKLRRILADGGNIRTLAQRGGIDATDVAGHAEVADYGTALGGDISEFDQKLMERHREQTQELGVSAATGKRRTFQEMDQGARIDQRGTRETYISARAASDPSVTSDDRSDNVADEECSGSEHGDGVLRAGRRSGSDTDVQPRLGLGRGISSRLCQRGGALRAEAKERYSTSRDMHTNSRRTAIGEDKEVDQGSGSGSESAMHTAGFAGGKVSVLSAVIPQDSEEERGQTGSSGGDQEAGTGALQSPTSDDQATYDLGGQILRGTVGSRLEAFQRYIDATRGTLGGYQCGGRGACTILTERARASDSGPALYGAIRPVTALRYGKSCARLHLGGREAIDLEPERSFVAAFQGRQRSSLVVLGAEEINYLGMDVTEGQLFAVLSFKIGAEADSELDLPDSPRSPTETSPCRVHGYTDGRRRLCTLASQPRYEPRRIIQIRYEHGQASLIFDSEEAIEAVHTQNFLQAMKGQPKACLVYLNWEERQTIDNGCEDALGPFGGIEAQYLVLALKTAERVPHRKIKDFGSLPCPYHEFDETYNCTIAGYKGAQGRNIDGSKQQRTNNGDGDSSGFDKAWSELEEKEDEYYAKGGPKLASRCRPGTAADEGGGRSGLSQITGKLPLSTIGTGTGPQRSEAGTAQPAKEKEMCWCMSRFGNKPGAIPASVIRAALRASVEAAPKSS